MNEDKKKIGRANKARIYRAIETYQGRTLLRCCITIGMVGVNDRHSMSGRDGRC